MSLFDRYVGMVVCSECGNKRCPHAASLDLACTGSNEPGQPGSNYPAFPAPGSCADCTHPAGAHRTDAGLALDDGCLYCNCPGFDDGDAA